MTQDDEAINTRAVNDIAHLLIVGDPFNADCIARVWARKHGTNHADLIRQARQQAEPFMSKGALDRANLYDKMLTPKDAISWTPTA